MYSTDTFWISLCCTIYYLFAFCLVSVPSMAFSSSSSSFLVNSLHYSFLSSNPFPPATLLFLCSFHPHLPFLPILSPHSLFYSFNQLYSSFSNHFSISPLILFLFLSSSSFALPPLSLFLLFLYSPSSRVTSTGQRLTLFLASLDVEPIHLACWQLIQVHPKAASPSSSALPFYSNLKFKSN